MKESQLIRIMTDPLNEVAEQVGKDNLEAAFHSKAIAYAIWLYRNNIITKEDIENKNNVTGYSSNEEEKDEYSTIKECILCYIDNHFFEDEFPSDDYKSIAKQYNLYNIDKEYLAKNEGSIINVNEEKAKPCVDLYTVEDNGGREIMKTADIEKAKTAKEEGPDRTIRNSRNKLVNAVCVSDKSKNAVNTVLKAGSQIECDNLNMYYKIRDTAPGRCISGTYYLFDGREFDGRYAICMKPELAGKDKSAVIGFVNARDLKK